MKVGELIRLKDGEEPRNGREAGTVLMFDIYKDDGRAQERITKVLWNTGKVGWVLTKRIELIIPSTCKHTQHAV